MEIDLTTLLSRTNWTNPDLDLLIHEIVEYDMRNGGFSIIREHRLISEREIEQILRIKDKHEQHVAIGNLTRDRNHKGLAAQMNEGFRQYRLRFGKNNELSPDDIVSIKKDALFVKKYCYDLKFGDYIEFREKNVYQGFIRINKLEGYWNEDRIDIKGVSDENLDRYHRDYTCKMIWRFMRHLVQYDNERAVKYIVRMMNDYKHLRLDPGYYRTFDDKSIYPVTLPTGQQLLISELGPGMLPLCNVEYNYKNVYIPLLNIATLL